MECPPSRCFRPICATTQPVLGSQTDAFPHLAGAPKVNVTVPLPQSHVAPAGSAQAGLYVTDTLSRNIYFAPAAELRPFAGSVLVGSELRGLFWVIRPNGAGFIAAKFPTNLTAKHYNLEGAAYVSS